MQICVDMCTCVYGVAKKIRISKGASRKIGEKYVPTETKPRPCQVAAAASPPVGGWGRTCVFAAPTLSQPSILFLRVIFPHFSFARQLFYRKWEIAM